MNIHKGCTHCDIASEANGLYFNLRSNMYIKPYFVYASCKAPESLRICAGSLEPLLLNSAIGTNFSDADFSLTLPIRKEPVAFRRC